MVRELKIVERPLYYGLLCRIILPQTQKLKITHIYYLTVSVGQESGHGLSGLSIKLLTKCQPGLSSYLRVDWRRIDFQVHMVAVIFKILASCWTEGLSFLLADCQSSPSVPCHVPCSLGQLPT